jgi:hypothetical protein
VPPNCPTSSCSIVLLPTAMVMAASDNSDGNDGLSRTSEGAAQLTLHSKHQNTINAHIDAVRTAAEERLIVDSIVLTSNQSTIEKTVWETRDAFEQTDVQAYVSAGE